MPWSKKQHAYFCANKKKSKQFDKMCHEGIKNDVEGTVMNDLVKKKSKK